MRVTEFSQLVADVFGENNGPWIMHSHVISQLGETANNLIEEGADLRHVWEELCNDFDVPEDERLGEDRPSL